MGTTSWTDAEDEALQGLPLEAQILYLRGLRRHMDYETGIVGARRRISWKMLAEVLEVAPHQGVERSGQPHISKVRRLMGWLIRAGLVEDVGSKERGQPIVFRLPLAARGQSVPKKPDKNPTRTRQGFPDNQADTESSLATQQVAEQADTQPDKNPTRATPQKADTHPVSGIREEGECRGSTSGEETPRGGLLRAEEGGVGGGDARASRSPQKRGTRLPDDWTLPPPWLAWALRHAPGWTQADVEAEAERFRDYWVAQPGQRGVKLDWAATWRNWIRRAAETRASRARRVNGSAASPTPHNRQVALEERNRAAAREWLERRKAHA